MYVHEWGEEEGEGEGSGRLPSECGAQQCGAQSKDPEMTWAETKSPEV